MKAATNNFRSYLILKRLAPLSVVSGQKEVVSEGDLWLLSGVLISQLPQGVEGPGFPREPVWHMLFLHLHVSSGEENLTTVSAPRFKLARAHRQGAQHLSML